MVARYAGALPWASSGGRSAVFTRPAYQDSVRDVTGSRRGVPDVSLSASFRGGFLSYGSFTGRGGWKPAGGTSVATPMMAGLVAIADQDAHTRLGLISLALYRLAQAYAPGIIPVTRGSNTVRFQQGGRTVTVHAATRPAPGTAWSPAWARSTRPASSPNWPHSSPDFAERQCPRPGSSRARSVARFA